jgi:hypothetical protein
MKHYSAETADPGAIVPELAEGDGAVMLSGLFRPMDIAEARAIVIADTGGEGSAYRRTGNLLARDPVFGRMAAHPVLMRVLRNWLGDEFVVAGLVGFRVRPGAPGQTPRAEIPPQALRGKTLGYDRRCALVTVILDSFTEEVGAPAYLPRSQIERRQPRAEDAFADRAVRILGYPGDVILCNGATWQCGMPNRSEHDRTAVDIIYLPRTARGVRDLTGGIPQVWLDTASPELRQLLAVAPRPVGGAGGIPLGWAGGLA